MPNMLRSKGTSFTRVIKEKDGQAGSLRRAVRLKASDQSGKSGEEDAERFDLAEFFANDPALAVRQTVSVLDKSIKKQRSIRHMNAQAYVDRELIGRALWSRLIKMLNSSRRHPIPREEIEDLARMWTWKIHPYSGYITTDGDVRPDQDENYAKIIASSDRSLDRAEFNGRWHHDLCVLAPNGKLDHAATTDRMWSHLVENEYKLKNTRDGQTDKPEQRDDQMIDALKSADRPSGLTGVRGERIATSVRDPRKSRKDGHYRDVVFGDEELDLYFRIDAAKMILETIVAGANEPIHASKFGELLHIHFGEVLNRTAEMTKEERRPLWSLHNHTRAFYRAIGKSERFRRADRADGDRRLFKDDLEPEHVDLLEELGFSAESKKTSDHPAAQAKMIIDLPERTHQMLLLLPWDQGKLLKAMEVKSRNAEIGELIRLGKLIVHASDLPRTTIGEKVDTEFQKRMDHFAESDGQSEIKRNEAFARIWRNAIGLSMRSLKLWVEEHPDMEISVREDGEDGEVNNDLASLPVAREAMRRKFNSLHYGQQLNVLFGDKRRASGDSRATIMSAGVDEDNKETLWTMLRIAGELRNRANHFTTKRRIVDLLKDGIVIPRPGGDLGTDFDHRKGEDVKQASVDRLDRLLDFDKIFDAEIVVDELNSLGFPDYVPAERRENLLGELCADSSGTTTLFPRFRSVIHRAQDIAKSFEKGADVSPEEQDAANERLNSVLVALDIRPREATKPGANKFRIEVLRRLYTHGFLTWIDGGADGLDQLPGRTLNSVEDVVRHTVAHMKVRSRREMERRELSHAQINDVLERLGVSELNDVNKLMQELSAVATSRERIRETYRVDRKLQSRTANDVERFRQELFVQLFERYLKVKGLEWLWDVDDETSNSERVELGLDDVRSITDWASAPWHSQFYAWLYLVPVDDIAMLRHQFLKTSALEEKAAGATDEDLVATLADLDRLMTLYGRVNSAGFDGTEHLAKLDAGAMFFDDPAQFKIVQDSDPETHDISFPGTRRGLRQIQRFGHTKVLEDVIEKHRVSKAEIEKLVHDNANETKVLFDRRRELHETIIAACKHQDFKACKNKDDLDKTFATQFLAICSEYEQTVVDTTVHNFGAGAARLTEFARLHQMMMRVVGRLNDYAGLWERDMIYLFLGMTYRQYAGKGPITLKKRAAVHHQDPNNREEVGDQLEMVVGIGEMAHHIRLWDERKGFNLPKFTNLAARNILNAKNAKQHKRFSLGDDRANKRDEPRMQRRRDMNRGRNLTFHQRSYPTIRNDFAHYNVLTQSGRRPNLTYQTNAIRSLFGYDRKLKNAVSKSIREIVAEAGVDLSWSMREDRLTMAWTEPMMETHLTMVPRKLELDVSFLVPRASVRFTSMVNALFDHDKGGNRAKINVIKKGKTQRRKNGIMAYPANMAERHDLRVPGAFRELGYMKLPSEKA